MLYQPHGKERIYIIRRGRVNVHAERTGRKRGANNQLKQIDMREDREIADNCYGYTAVISTRPTRLYAFAKDFTSAYFIENDKFKEGLSERVSDIENYHEIKSKMDLSPCWEAFEAPRLQSPKHHYHPTKINIIRKQIQMKTRNQRADHSRWTSSCYRGVKHLYDPDSTRFLREKITFDSQLIEATDHDDDGLLNSGEKALLEEGDEFEMFVK